MLGTALELHYDPLVKFNIAVKKKSEIGSVVKYRIKTPR